MKNNYMIEIVINKLFGSQDYYFKLDSNLNVLIGENGCGKTTILKMINNIINNDFIALSKIPFETIELTVNKKREIIKYNDIIQLNESIHPEFRFVVKEKLKYSKTFEEFYDNVLNGYLSLTKCNKKNDCEYQINFEKYIKDDIIFKLNKYSYDQIEKMVKKNAFSKCVYGSKKWLEQIYNIHNNMDAKLIIFPKIKKSYFYSFIDLDEKYYRFNKLNFIDKYKIKRYLLNFIIEKEDRVIRFIGNDLEVYKKSVNKKITHLSSGEKKIIQLYKAIYNMDRSTILFLDEPELSMSFIWRKSLTKMLLKYSKKSKIVCASQQMYFELNELDLMVPMINR